MTLPEFIRKHSARGECRCGKCFDRGDAPDPEGHTADMIFFPVAAIESPSREEFERLIAGHEGEFCQCDPLDGAEYNYMELGAWLGDQGLALCFMGLGTILGTFQLMTPKTMMPGALDDNTITQMAGAGFVTVRRAA
jgi:hypothetical protein